MKRKQAHQFGFTLVEMMIVIVIIGILAGIGIPRFRTVINQSKVVEFKPILAQIYSLETSYYSENDKFTDDLGLLGFDDPKAKYFSFSVEADSTEFTAVATCTGDLKGEGGVSLKGMKLTLDQNEDRGGDLPLRRLARW